MSKRPYVICHMIASIDGKILTRRWRELPASKAIGGLYDSTAAEYEVGSWLVGTTTMKEFCTTSTPLPTTRSSVPEGDFVANAESETHAIGLDAHGVLRFKENEIGGDHTIIIITEKVGDSYRAHLRDLGISYLVCGSAKIDLPLMMEKLRDKFKLKKVLLEGGGVLNGVMLQAGLVDEISQIIAPVVDGGGPDITGLYEAPTGKSAKTSARALRLISHQPLKGGAQWLRYRVQN